MPRPLSLPFLLAAASLAHAGPAERDAARARAEAAEKAGLPKSSAEAWEPVYADALKDGAWAEAVEALVQGVRARTRAGADTDADTLEIAKLAEAADTAPAPVRPVLRTLLAHALRGHLQTHSYELRGRTALADPRRHGPASLTPAVLKTLPAASLLALADDAYRAALADEAALRAIPLSAYSRLVEPGNLPASRRPTLFDFLIHDAIGFHTEPHRLVARPADALVLASDSPALAPASRFLDWRPAGRDTDPTVRVVSLFQRRLRAHAPDSDAFADADLARLEWASRAVSGDKAAERARAALRTFARAHEGRPVAAEALALLAESLLADDRADEARAVALAGEKAAAGTPGGDRCADIRRRIEQPSLTLSGERVWNAPWPRITVTRRNVSRIAFRIVKSDWKKFLDRDRGRPEWLSENEKKELYAAPVEREWIAELPRAGGFDERTDRVAVPENLAPGFYFLLATDGPDFSGKTAPVLVTDFWVSRLAATVSPDADAVSGRIHDALTGEPVPGARVEGWRLDRAGDRVSCGVAKANAFGEFRLDVPERRSALLLVTAPDGHALASMSEYAGTGPRHAVREHNRVVFLTDRAAYRPGQTVRFKGVVIRADPENQKFRPISERRVTVVLDDPNGKEAGRIQVVTNEFGAFEGAITAPADRLPGVHQLHTSGNENGRVAVRVEEYKRPTFEVAFDPPAPGAALGGRVTLAGRALAYTGAPADGAKVVWRVTRSPRIPRWCGWIQPEPPREIASGETVANAEGRFSVAFDAEAAEGRDTEGVSYAYDVHADVTDAAGETRSASRTVALARADTLADLAADTASGTITVSLKSPDGEPRQNRAAKLVFRRLREPAYVHRAPLETERWRISYKRAAVAAAKAAEEDDASGDGVNLADPARWQPGDTVAEATVTTGKDGSAALAPPALPPGHYRVSLETQDTSGRPVTARTLLPVFPTSGDTFGLKIPFATLASRTQAKPGESVAVTWGSGYDSARATFEIMRPGAAAPEVIRTEPGRTLRTVNVPLTESDRGSVLVRVSQVRENRFYHAEHRIAVPFDDRKLTVSWSRFTDRLMPGAPVSWTARVTAPDGAPVAAEVAATLYDASLDPFMKLEWPDDLGLWRDRLPWTPEPSFLNAAKPFRHARGAYPEIPGTGAMPAPPEWRPDYAVNTHRFFREAVFARAGAAPAMALAKNESAADLRAASFAPPEKTPGTTAPAPDLDSLKPRANLAETAFWFPRVTTTPDGAATFAFTAPEALTRWRCLVFAHDRTLRAGRLESAAVTALDLMVRPNAPRFLREGDIAEIPVRIVNATDRPLAGAARLTFSDLDTAASRDAALGNDTPDRPFTVAPHTSVTLGWKVRVPDGEKFLRYTVKAADAAGAADGETGAIPVLPRRMHVVESAAGAIRGPGETTLRLPALNALGSPGATLRPDFVSVQTVARPAWYAVQALPYLMEYPHECSEQIFHRLYANTLAASVATRRPEMRAMFERWRGGPALDSPLLKNADLKQIAVEETPWVREAGDESARRRRVALLFDEPAMKAARAAALAKLEERRAPDGGWSWFPGARESSDWVTRTIVLGFGRLRELGASDDVSPAVAAIPVLDAWIRRELENIREQDRDTWSGVSSELAHHLHARSFFLKDAPPEAATETAIRFFLGKCAAHWTSLDLASQARLALALGAYGDAATPAAIVKSLRERAINDPVRGMRWKDGFSPAFWRPWVAPVETQALLAEVFDTVAKDREASDACRLALLDMKRTIDWGSTTATAEACHALLLRGEDWTAGSANVVATVGARELKPADVEPGTGATDVRVPAAGVSKELASVKFSKADAGPAWVSLHASYEEDAAKVKPAAGSAIAVKQEFFKKILTLEGPVLEALPGNRAAPGDEVIVRVTLANDRDLDFVHLKTARPAALEPGVAVSGYRWQGGLSWHEAVRDTATHRFIERLPQGVHVFEFSARADRRGVFRGGITEARCLYAPDFAAHTEAPTLTVE